MTAACNFISFPILKGSEMTAACNFIFLGEKMRELLDENGKRKKKKKRKEKITDHLIGQKRREICALCRSVSQRS